MYKYATVKRNKHGSKMHSKQEKAQNLSYCFFLLLISGSFFVLTCSFLDFHLQCRDTKQEFKLQIVILLSMWEEKKKQKQKTPSQRLQHVRTVGGCETWREHPGLSERKSSNRKAAVSSCRVCDTGCSIRLKLDFKKKKKNCLVWAWFWTFKRPSLTWFGLRHQSKRVKGNKPTRCRKCLYIPIWLGLCRPLKTRSFPAPLRSKL